MGCLVQPSNGAAFFNIGAELDRADALQRRVAFITQHLQEANPPLFQFNMEVTNVSYIPICLDCTAAEIESECETGACFWKSTSAGGGRCVRKLSPFLCVCPGGTPGDGCSLDGGLSCGEMPVDLRMALQVIFASLAVQAFYLLFTRVCEHWKRDGRVHVQGSDPDVEEDRASSVGATLIAANALIAQEGRLYHTAVRAYNMVAIICHFALPMVLVWFTKTWLFLPLWVASMPSIWGGDFRGLGKFEGILDCTFGQMTMMGMGKRTSDKPTRHQQFQGRQPGGATLLGRGRQEWVD